MATTYTHHEHSQGLGNCEKPFDFSAATKICTCDPGNVASDEKCPCATCRETRRAECPHTRTYTDVYDYTECLECHASHGSPINPLTKCYLNCTQSSYGLCPADCSASRAGNN